MPLRRSQIVAVIPARAGSTRLPNKPLALIDGHPLIFHVVRQALDLHSVDRVVVATDDPDIEAAANQAGAEAVLTGEHPCGSDRCAEAAVHVPEAGWIINLQADVLGLTDRAITALLAPLQEENAARMSTLAVPLRDEGERQNPGVVKVWIDDRGEALTFARHCASLGDQGDPWRHVGLYAFHPQALADFAALAPSSGERREKLEQLRWLEAGKKLAVATLPEFEVEEVNTPDDLERVRRIFHAR